MAAKYDYDISTNVTVTIEIDGHELTARNMRGFDDEETAACALARKKLDMMFSKGFNVRDWEFDTQEISFKCERG